MTTMSGISARPAHLPATPAVIFAVLGVIDIALLGVVGSSIALLGLVTLMALVPARRGSRPALVTVVAARVISALLAFAAFFAHAPVWVMAVEGPVIVATIVGLALLRRRPARRMA
jgi:hypothetical protein